MSIPEPADTPPQYPIESVGNALRLLLMFGRSPQVRLSEARDELGVAQSTAHRLMAMLVYYGFVRQDPATRAYVAGQALVEVGLSVVRSMDIRSLAHDLLEELSTATQETVHLAQLEGTQVRFLDSVECGRALRVSSRTGLLLPAYSTSIGKALLAHLDTAALHVLYPGEEFTELPTSRTMRTRAALEAELAKVRKRGYASNAGESEEGVGSVGVAVVHPTRGPVAALSVAAPLHRIPAATAREVAKRLQQTAERLADRLP